ncbi:membrane protein [Streptococcus pneumoniae]|nr:membrane protein [Streptococcus pneumoniae]
MSNSLKGTLLTVVAGIAWGLSGTSGQYLMANT